MAADYEPLLDAGIHPMSVPDMKEMLVDAFNDGKEHREYLYSRLHVFLENLAQLIGRPFRVWIDGSFLSNKPEPADVDLVVIAEARCLNALGEQEKEALRQIFGTERQTVKQRFSCDVYLMLEGDADQERYWRNLFGHDRDGRPKGIVEVGL
ncbi:hypothetical protein H0Z60_06335 [Ectothiorhodospiraceae bacterium WFHF3C12]|nr:hypothetical protein [Ectothiorhodospiraceae bacterium WFHF3C12]